MKQLFGIMAAAILLPVLGFAQLDRGAITGTVTDNTGAVIPSAKVTIRNANTNASYETVTTSAGEYMMPNLPNGIYDLTFAVSGFKSSIRRNVSLGATEIQRVDATLEIGIVTQSVEVTAQAAHLQTDSPEVSTTLTDRNMAELPLGVDSGGRTMETVIYKIVPGAQGNTWSSHINGSQSFGLESLLDGATVMTEMMGYFAEMSVSMEAVQEFKVQTNAYSAEFGRTQGSVLNYVMKSGTNTLHGSAFGLLRNEVLDANTFVNNSEGLKRPIDRQWDYALSLGGPVYIPKVYNGKNKTFFYFSVEPYSFKDLAYAAPSASDPIPAFYKGDFSRLLGPATGATDALGNGVLTGAIYDPATFYQLPSGQWEGQIFPGNIIPASRISRVAQNLNAIASQDYQPTVVGANGVIPLQDNAQLPLNSIFKLTQAQYSVKMDENISDRHKLSGSLTINHRPRWEAYYDSTGMWNPNLPDGGPLSQEIFQDLKAYYARIADDTIISPTKLNHFMLYFNRFHNWFNPVDADVDGAKALGIQGIDTTGYPTFQWGGGPIYPLSQPGRASAYDVSYDTYGIMDTYNFSHGSHFMKVGFDGNLMRSNTLGSYNDTFNFSPLSTSLPNYSFSGELTGYSFASYLLGIVYSDNLNTSVPITDVSKYMSGFFQDDYKVTKRLSLSLGVRWDWESAIDEAHNRLDGWTPAVTDPLSGLPGAYVFASGNCQTYCLGGKYLGNGNTNRLVPRIGFAYQVSSNTTVRGGYSIFNQTYGQPNQPLWNNIRNAWLGTWETGPNAINGWAGMFNIDQGVPASNYSAASFNPSWGDFNTPAYFDSRYPKMPYIQHWNFNVQHSFPKNWVLDLGYLATKGTALRNDSMEALNQLNPSYLQQFGTNLLNPVTTAAQAAANGIAYPYPGFSGTVASALRPYPQVMGNSTINVTGASLGFSNTQQLQVALDKRLNSALSLYMNFVWSKTLTNVDDAVTGSLVPQNYYNLAAEKAIADYDVPRSLKAAIVYELPVGRGKPLLSGSGRVLNGLVGGWGVSAILTYQDGLPLIFTTSSSPLPGAWNGGVRINVASASNMLASGYSKSAFNLADISAPSNTYLNVGDYSDVQPLTLGTAAYTYSQARGFGTINEDISLSKSFRIREKARIQLRAEALDAFNRATLGVDPWSGPNGGIITNVTNSLFGQVTEVTGNRLIQVAVRLDF